MHIPCLVIHVNDKLLSALCLLGVCKEEPWARWFNLVPVYDHVGPRIHKRPWWYFLEPMDLVHPRSSIATVGGIWFEVHGISFLVLSFFSSPSWVISILIVIFLPSTPALGLRCCLIFIGPIAIIPTFCLCSLPAILSPMTVISCKVFLSFSLSFSFVPRSAESSTLSPFSFPFSSFSFSFPGSSSLKSSLIPWVVMVIPDPKASFKTSKKPSTLFHLQPNSRSFFPFLLHHAGEMLSSPDPDDSWDCLPLFSLCKTARWICLSVHPLDIEL